jgi:hypothetical protein
MKRKGEQMNKRKKEREGRGTHARLGRRKKEKREENGGSDPPLIMILHKLLSHMYVFFPLI